MATGKKEEQSEVSGNRGMEVQLVLCGFPTKLECGVSPPIKTLAILPRPPTHQPHPPAPPTSLPVPPTSHAHQPTSLAHQPTSPLTPAHQSSPPAHQSISPLVIPAGWQLRIFRSTSRPVGPDSPTWFPLVLQGLAERGQRVSEFSWDS